METTQKEPEDSLTDIQLLLRGKTAQEREARPFQLSKFMASYDDNTGNIDGVIFSIKLKNTGEEIPFRMPANWKAIQKYGYENNNTRLKNEDQARRVAWRHVYRWLQSQMAMITLQMVSPHEAFLPYIWDGKKTLFEAYDKGLLKLEVK